MEMPLRTVTTVIVAMTMALHALAGAAGGTDRNEVPLTAVPFPLPEVRLLDGPFKTAQQADATYMLSLDPDRLLHVFRLNAGLPTNAQPLGGWEAPNCELRGHFVGHYLSGCSLMYAATGDERFKQRVDLIVTELGKCQQALGDGYLSAFPESFFDRLESGQKVWAPYYTIHKIMAGLLDAYQYCGNAQALDIDNAMVGYFKGRIDKLSDDQMQQVMRTEFGGMMEVLANLYGVTGNADALALAKRFDHHAVLDPLADRQDKLAGLHANTQIPKMTGATRVYELTGEDRYHTVPDFFWNTVTISHSFITGGNSFGEHFKTPGIEATALSPTTSETCNTYNMLKLTRHLFEWDPQAKYMDYYERALFNHILGSIDPQTGMSLYFLSLAPGHFKVYSTPTDSFWCCTGTGLENHAKYGDTIYARSADGGTLWVNLFIASELQWKEKGITIEQITKFPDEPKTSLTLKTAGPIQLSIRLRIPQWAQGATVKVNDQPQSIDARPGSYATIDRQWNNGDRIELSLPMSLHLYRPSDDPSSVVVMDGPIVLAGQFGRDQMPPSDQAPNQTQFNKVPRVAVPPLTVNPDADPNTWLTPIPGQAIAFTTNLAKTGSERTLIPLAQVHHERYTVYWKTSAATAPPSD
jgi:DUF1680 family protein